MVSDPEFVRHGHPLTAITVVNDNMPFLFDSIVGEVTDTAGEASFVAHPVIGVRHGGKGVVEIVADGAKGEDVDRISVIHIHVNALTEKEARGLQERLGKVLGQVRASVAGWKPMLARLDRAISELRSRPVPLNKDAVAEAVAFLEWLRDDNFTFLGMREFRYSGGEKSGTLTRAANPGLGILADPNVRVLRRAEGEATTPEIRAFLYGPEPLIVTKANAKSVVHRRAYLDYIGIKTFDRKGKLSGELRVVGLFTSTAYTRSVMKIPYLRSKAETVIRKSGFDPSDHSGKALINVLESYPRDELFQIPVPTLRKHADAILGLVERPRVRALYRVDQFDRFVSVIVFVPRDRYDSVVREKIGAYLKTAFEGRLSAYYPAFPEGTLARVHFIIGRSGGKTPKVDPATIEEAIRDIVRTWEDSLRESALTSGADLSLLSVAARLPESYRGSFTAAEALLDARRLVSIGPNDADRHRLLPACRPAARAGRAQDLPPRQAGRPVAPRAGAGKHRLQGDQRAHLRGPGRTRRARLHPRHGTRERVRKADRSFQWRQAVRGGLPLGLAARGRQRPVQRACPDGRPRRRGHRRAARLRPLSAAGGHPAEPGLHRRRSQPLSRHRARICTTCSSPASIPRPARRAASPPST